MPGVTKAAMIKELLTSNTKSVAGFFIHEPCAYFTLKTPTGAGHKLSGAGMRRRFVRWPSSAGRLLKLQ